jgi:hypothetical protein
VVNRELETWVLVGRKSDSAFRRNGCRYGQARWGYQSVKRIELVRLMVWMWVEEMAGLGGRRCRCFALHATSCVTGRVSLENYTI